MRDFTTRAFLSRIGQATRPSMVSPTRRPFAEAPEKPSIRRLLHTLLTLSAAGIIATVALFPPSLSGGWLHAALQLVHLQKAPLTEGNTAGDTFTTQSTDMTSPHNASSLHHGTGDGESRDMPILPPPTSVPASALPAGTAPENTGNHALTSDADADDYDAAYVPPPPVKPKGPYSIAERMQQFGPTATERLQPAFKKAGIAFPPTYATLIGLKEEKHLQLYAAGPDKKYALIKTYSVRAASGGAGPKLREGDGQVPEGLYRVELLNPNSSYHLSLRVNYPCDYDRDRAKEDGRDKLGGDIMIHGKAVSIGCLAMGDRAIEELFVLGGRMAKLENYRILLTPYDFRTCKAEQISASPSDPKWTAQLYERIRIALEKYPLPGASQPPPPAPSASRHGREKPSSRPQ